MGCGAPTVARRVSDDLLRYPATIPQQPAIQSAAMGAVQFARRLAQYAIDASDWRLWAWGLCKRWVVVSVVRRLATIQAIMARDTPPLASVQTTVGTANPP